MLHHEHSPFCALSTDEYDDDTWRRITDACSEVRSDALSGVSFSSVLTGDAFLTFRASNGKTAAINMHALADRSGPITKSAIRCWIKDNTPNAQVDAPSGAAAERR